MAPTASAPSTAERWNCRASSAAGPASPQVRRSARRAPRSARPSAAIKASFSGKSGGGVTQRLTHIRDVAATKKNTVPNTGPSSHPQTGREQLRKRLWYYKQSFGSPLDTGEEFAKIYREWGLVQRQEHFPADMFGHRTGASLHQAYYRRVISGRKPRSPSQRLRIWLRSSCASANQAARRSQTTYDQSWNWFSLNTTHYCQQDHSRR